jgi:acetate kinase
MLILVINCGSSSAKYKLFDMKKTSVLSSGLIERIGHDNSELTHKKKSRVFKKHVSCKNHEDAIKIIVGALTDKKTGAISSKNVISGVGHRVVHGGDEIRESVPIDKRVLGIVEKYTELAPLHNPPSLSGIKACIKILPKTRQVAVFDTAFHQSMRAKAYIYALPYDYYTRHKIRKYGFHGTSHRFVSQRAAEKLGRPLSELFLITCHLGNGCSMSAVKRGKSIDTSMGFTPLEGLVMGTRCGDLDPAIITFLMEKEHFHIREIDTILNKKSGLLGISGLSNDMRDLLKAAKKGDKRAKLAIEIFIYRIEKYIGAYIAAMGGCDAIVFTAGIGENVPMIRERIGRDLREIFKKLGTSVLTVATDEESLIARDTHRIINEKTKKTKRR